MENGQPIASTYHFSSQSGMESSMLSHYYMGVKSPWRALTPTPTYDWPEIWTPWTHLAVTQ